MAGYSIVPVSAGDACEPAALTEIKAAIQERRTVYDGGTVTLSVPSVPDEMSAANLNSFRNAVKTMLKSAADYYPPAWLNPTTYKPWCTNDANGAANNIFKEAIGAGATDFSKVPDSTYGDLVAGTDKTYKEHINEIRLVLNKMTVIEFPLITEGFVWYKIGVYTSSFNQGTLDAAWNNYLADTPDTGHPGGEPITYVGFTGLRSFFQGVTGKFTFCTGRRHYRINATARLAAVTIDDVKMKLISNTYYLGWYAHNIEAYACGATPPTAWDCGVYRGEAASSDIIDDQGIIGLNVADIQASGYSYFSLRTDEISRKPDLTDFADYPTASKIYSASTILYRRNVFFALSGFTYT